MRLAVEKMNDQSDSIEPPSSTDAATDLRRPGGIRRWLKGLRNGRNGGSTLRETLEELIEQHEEREDPIDPRERQLIERILTVGEVTAEDAMVPRADIVAVESGTYFVRSVPVASASASAVPAASAAVAIVAAA